MSDAWIAAMPDEKTAADSAPSSSAIAPARAAPVGLAIRA